MSFFSSILGHRGPLLGVDIGTTSIKVAEVAPGKEQFILANYAMLENESYLDRFNEAFQTSSLKLSEQYAVEYLKIVLERSKTKIVQAVASIPAFLAFSTLIEVPEMSDGERKRFIDEQAKQYIPMPLSTVAFDWMKVGERIDESKVKRDQILLVSIPSDEVEKYKRIFKTVGLNLISVEVEGMSLARVLSEAVKEPTIIIDIGGRSTSLSIASGGFLKFSGQTDFAGGSLTQTIATGLNISQRRAEDLKRQRGLAGLGAEHELSTLISPIIDVIISEARRVIANFEAHYGERVKSAIIAGGGAGLLGIEDYFNKQFGLPTSTANPFKNLNFPEILSPAIKDTGPLLAVALGLGMKKI